MIARYLHYHPLHSLITIMTPKLENTGKASSSPMDIHVSSSWLRRSSKTVTELPHHLSTQHPLLYNRSWWLWGSKNNCKASSTPITYNFNSQISSSHPKFPPLSASSQLIPPTRLNGNSPSYWAFPRSIDHTDMHITASDDFITPSGHRGAYAASYRVAPPSKARLPHQRLPICSAQWVSWPHKHQSSKELPRANVSFEKSISYTDDAHSYNYLHDIRLKTIFSAHSFCSWERVNELWTHAWVHSPDLTATKS